MVTALTTNSTRRCSQSPTRPPSLRSDPNNAPPRRPKTREVSSRYLSLSTSSSSSNSSSSTNTSPSFGSSVPSRRSQSPTISRRAAINTPLSSVKERAVSAERRRPATNAERMMTTSVRSLSVSFQGDPFPRPVNRVKQAPMSFGKGTPEKRKTGVAPVRDQTENSKPSDQQHRWPGRLRGQNSKLLTQSLDCAAQRGNELKELKKRVVDEKTGNKGGKLDNLSVFVDHLITSSPKSVLSKGTTKGNNEIRLRGRPNKIVVPAMFGKEVINRGLKQLDPASPVSNNPLSQTCPSKLIVAKKFQNDSHLSPSLKTCARVASPSKALLIPSAGALFRGLASPIRTRNGVGNMTKDSDTCCTPSMLGFAAVVRKGNLGENQIFDACDLRLLHNRQLQWRLVNARSENALLAQKQAAERNLYSSWTSTSKLRNSVMSKRAELQLLRHNLKLYIILKEQVLHLENWDITEKDNFNSLSGIIKALEASTIRLPTVNGARADVENLHEAISSAVAVMQSVTSSTHPLLTKVEQTNSLMSDLCKLSVRERGLLDETRDFLSTAIIPFQVKYCSMKAHALQLQATL